MRLRYGWSFGALLLCLAGTVPAGAADTGFKADLDALLQRLEPSTHGLLKWDGADRMEVRSDGNAEIAEFANARVVIGPEEGRAGAPTRVVFDHVEIRRAPAADGALAYNFVLPTESALTTPDGGETKLTLREAKGHVTVDAQSGRARDTGASFAGARLEDKKSGDWISLGSMSLSSKVAAGSGSGWTAPVDFELKQIEYFFSEAPVGGVVDRIAYTARSSGPDLAALNRLRDRIDAVQKKDDAPPEQRLDELLDILPSLPALFSEAKGEFTIEHVTARAPTGEPLFGMDKASFGGSLTGLSGDAASLRVTLKEDGVTLSPTILDKDKVPRRVVLDFGIEDVGTGPLRKILETAAKLRKEADGGDQAQATQQMLGAAAMLNPVIRVYELTVDTPDTGVAATAEVRGSPISPKGYSGQGDVTIRGFEALLSLVGDAQFLPLLQEIGTAGQGSDGVSQLKFHLASTPQKLLTINGNDVTGWFAPVEPAGQPRTLRPAEPAMSGADVGAVQKALAAAKFPVSQNGVYDPATAVAVARYQKANGLNVNGVVDAATRQKLGVKAEAPPPAGPKPPRPGGR